MSVWSTQVNVVSQAPRGKFDINMMMDQIVLVSSNKTKNVAIPRTTIERLIVMPDCNGRDQLVVLNLSNAVAFGKQSISHIIFKVPSNAQTSKSALEVPSGAGL